MAELLCGKPAGWAKTVHNDSIVEILEEGDRQNAAFFGRWLQRRVARLQRLAPAAQMPIPSTLPNLSPKSASTPD